MGRLGRRLWSALALAGVLVFGMASGAQAAFSGLNGKIRADRAHRQARRPRRTLQANHQALRPRATAPGGTAHPKVTLHITLTAPNGASASTTRKLTLRR